MNMIGVIVISVLTICMLALGKFIIYPRISSWMNKRAQKEKYLNEQKELIEFEQEVKFHLSWAQDRGESTKPFSEELNEIQFKIENLQRKYPEVELSTPSNE